MQTKATTLLLKVNRPLGAVLYTFWCCWNRSKCRCNIRLTIERWGNVYFWTLKVRPRQRLKRQGCHLNLPAFNDFSITMNNHRIQRLFLFALAVRPTSRAILRTWIFGHAFPSKLPSALKTISWSSSQRKEFGFSSPHKKLLKILFSNTYTFPNLIPSSQLY